jgi:hypothetical protein
VKDFSRNARKISSKEGLVASEESLHGASYKENIFYIKV